MLVAQETKAAFLFKAIYSFLKQYMLFVVAITTDDNIKAIMCIMKNIEN